MLKRLKNHELLGDDVRLFQAKVFYTKVPNTISTYRMKPGVGKQVLHVEDKVIAIQSLHEVPPDIITTGKDQSWAVRTMRGRMKKKIVNIMGILDD